MATLDLREAAAAHVIPITVSPALMESVMATWRGRMINEYQSATVFEQLLPQLEAAGLSQKWLDECRGFADEERRHGILCGAVVASLGGSARAQVMESEPFPLHADAKPLEAALRNVLSICCLSETIAVALVGAERLEMPEGPLKELLTRIYADECGHSNFGWRLMRDILPDDAALKARLSAYLKVAFAHLEGHELAHLPLESRPPAEAAAYGVCSGADARRLFYAAVFEVIIPALEALGLDARGAWEEREKGLFRADSAIQAGVRAVRAEAARLN